MEPTEQTEREDDFVAELTKSQNALSLYVRSLLPGEPGFDEVVQQANAKIWQKRNEFSPGTHFRAWAFAIARFEVLNFRKQQARNAKLTFSPELEEIIADECDSIPNDLADRQLALQHCLNSMKSKHRDLLLTRYGSGETLHEFASRLGRSAGSLKVTLFRLRTVLQDCIERRLRTQGESA